jgi:uncharacterized membrane protein YagU involved in acid resistance
MKSNVVKREYVSRKVIAGVTGGLIGGAFFGVLLGALGMLPAIAELVGGRSFGVGLTVHTVISASFGALFGLLFERHLTSLWGATVYGTAYGIFWWVLGALILMPVLLGMGPQFHAAFTTANLLSLSGHIVYGVVLAITTYVLVQHAWLRH